MIITEVLGNVAITPLNGRQRDPLHLEWFEPTKRILRKHSAGGREMAIKLVREGQRLHEGDIVWQDEHTAVVVDILPSEAIVVTPTSLLQMGTICYEIGNKHLPMFIQDDQVLVPYEAPLFRLLEATGYQPLRQTCKLLNMLKANVEPHGHGGGSSSGGESLFTKILNLTTKA